MFGGRYFGRRFFGARYWGDGGSVIIHAGPWRFTAKQAPEPGSKSSQAPVPGWPDAQAPAPGWKSSGVTV